MASARDIKTSPQDRAPPGSADDNATLQLLLAELDRPLDDIDWRHTSILPAIAPEKRELREREREHRRELHRAREAAQKAFGVKPRLSARKRATMMLTGGAVGLAAFTSPVSSQVDHRPVEATQSASETRQPAAHLRASSAFKRALMQEEGVRYTVYRDVAGYPTVGVGHLVQPGDGLRVGDTVTQAQVMRFLEDDLITAEQGVRDLVGDLPLHQHEFDALLDLVYNVGRGTVGESRSPRLNAAIEARDYDAIADELAYTRAGGAVARGLEFRSDRRTAIFLNAHYDDPRTLS